MMKAFFRGSVEGVQNAETMKMVDADCISDIARRVVIAAATEGRAVIVGRGAAYYLHDRPDTLHVFIYAPTEEKMRRLQIAGESRQRAQELVETVDRDRAAFIKQYFKRDWPDRQLFHLMINSAVGDDAVVATVLHGLHHASQRLEEPRL
jgi:cytidylate kinase